MDHTVPASVLVEEICRAVARGDDGEIDRLLARLTPDATVEELMLLRSRLAEQVEAAYGA